MYGKHEKKLALARSSGETNASMGHQRYRNRIIRITDWSWKQPDRQGPALAQQLTEPRGTLVLKSTFHGAGTGRNVPMS